MGGLEGESRLGPERRDHVAITSRSPRDHLAITSRLERVHVERNLQHFGEAIVRPKFSFSQPKVLESWFPDTNFQELSAVRIIMLLNFHSRGRKFLKVGFRTPTFRTFRP